MKMDTLTKYKQLRSNHWSAREALRAARICARFASYEGRARIVAVSDDMPYEYGDAENEKATRKRLEEYGLFGLVAQAKCPCCGEWKAVDAVWGFIGDDLSDNGYDLDLMEAAMEAADASHNCD